MLPSPRYRVLYQAENADDGSRLSVPDMPEEAYEDALDDAVSLEDVVERTPAWWCDHCGQRNYEWACIHCGREREDV